LFVCSDRILQRPGGGVGEINGNCMDARTSLRDASDAGMTLSVCVVKSNGTIKLGDELTEVKAAFSHIL